MTGRSVALTPFSPGGVPSVNSQADLMSLAGEARDLLAAHQPGGEGVCVGCLRQWRLLVRYPCGQARGALEIHRRIPSPDTVSFLGLAASGVRR